MAYEYYRTACKKLSIPINKYELWRKTTKALGLSKSACLRLEWIIYYYTKANKNASLTVRHFGIPRSQWYYWFNRFDETNLKSLENQSTAPKNVRQKEISIIQEQRILVLRKQHMHWGKMKIKRLYEKTFKEQISSHKVQCVIQKYNLYPKPARNDKIQAKRQKSVKKKKITELKVKLPYLGYLLHFDTIEIYWNGLKRYIITVIDDFTKMAFARMYTNKSSRSAEDFLYRVDYLLDGRIAKAHQDNGSEFQKYFSQLCNRLNIKQYYSRPRTPKDNPSLERFNQTLQYEWLRDGNFTTDVNKFNARLKKFIIEYNSIRPHETLDYLTPIEFAVKYKQLSERYPSCTCY